MKLQWKKKRETMAAGKLEIAKRSKDILINWIAVRSCRAPQNLTMLAAVSKLSPANERFLETITNPGQLRNIARAYDNHIQFSTMLGLFFTQVGLTNPNFGGLLTLSATEHNLTYLLGMLAQLGGINAMNGDAVATLTDIRNICERAGLYAPGAHLITPPEVTPDGQQRPGLGANFRGGDGGQHPNAPAAG